ncbi:hypothetical protein N0V92_003271 [Colletotrichum tropicale]|nr:hypothetical protein N0V92_003271 [Colletotrichum tropicale]
MPPGWPIKIEPIHGGELLRVPHVRQPLVNMTFSLLDRLKYENNPDVWERHVAKALPILDKLEPICKSMSSSPRLSREMRVAATNWVNDIGAVRQRAAQRSKIVIGVFGGTGDGKSSTINALLDEASLLPTNCMRACTACVTEISYNDDDDPENPYRAEIDFVSPEDWMREIRTFLKEVAANNVQPYGDEDEDEMDLDASEAAKSVAKARAVYANIDNEVLLESSPHELIRHPNVYWVLGTTRTFKAATGRDLRRQVERYIDSTDENDDETVAYWPLVKAVRIFTRAEALSNGVTIADLPGTHDADAARASMAKEYMKSCAAIWIVAPIHRAVDNKTARDLLSDNFKHQLNLDGSFSSVTFICTKTDQISLSDAMNNLKRHLDPKIIKYREEAATRRQEIKLLKKKILNLRMSSGLTEDSEDDFDMHQPAKRVRIERIDEYRKQLEIDENDLNDLDEMVRMACIQKRNDISRDTLRNYFNRIVREARQKSSLRRNDTGNAQLEDDISGNLPVFCTSSHAYQALRGLSEDDMDEFRGFFDNADTDIPQLQSHAQTVTNELRIAKQREVLAGIYQVLNSVSLWTQNTPDLAAALSSDTLSSLLDTFERTMSATINVCLDHIQHNLNGLFATAHQAARVAEAEAALIVFNWFLPKRSGGIYHSTLRALVVRRGVWGPWNLNEELLEPFSNNILHQWAGVFQRDVPGHLDDFLVDAVELLSRTHDRIMRKLRETAGEDLRLRGQLDMQLKLHKDGLKRISAEVKNTVNRAQKLASREPLQVVGAFMNAGYGRKGMMKRMRNVLSDHLAVYERDMFFAVTSVPEQVLQEAARNASDILVDRVGGILRTMRTDYVVALAKREESARRAEALFKEKMVEVLKFAQPLIR